MAKSGAYPKDNREGTVAVGK